MYWIVRKDNPKPDVYIPIFVESSTANEKFQDSEKFQIFRSESGAITFAKQLFNEFAVRSIRLFYEDGHSQNIR